jgi:haloacetate dehalogenase
MSDPAQLFPGFSARYVSTDAGRMFALTGGSGPPLALLHGFPESLVMWHRLAPRLAAHFSVVAMDLRGYGWSPAPASEGGTGYTKRRMGEDVVALMEALGHTRFALAGHDRGARVGYRLALDHPGRIERLALLDIVPTMEVWRQMEADAAVSPHWRFLAEPAPAPETTIATDPDAYFEGLLSQWSGGRMDGFAPEALAFYRAAWGDRTRIHAMCEDYRAGAGADREADLADEAAGRTIACPVHIIASYGYLQKPGREPALDTWRRTFAPNATGDVLDCGHFIAEDAAGATLASLSAFLSVPSA